MFTKILIVRIFQDSNYFEIFPKKNSQNNKYLNTKNKFFFNSLEFLKIFKCNDTLNVIALWKRDRKGILLVN